MNITNNSVRYTPPVNFGNNKIIHVVKKVGGGKEHKRLQEKAAPLVQPGVNAITIEDGQVQIAGNGTQSTFFGENSDKAIERALASKIRR